MEALRADCALNLKADLNPLLSDFVHVILLCRHKQEYSLLYLLCMFYLL